MDDIENIIVKIKSAEEKLGQLVPKNIFSWEVYMVNNTEVLRDVLDLVRSTANIIRKCACTECNIVFQSNHALQRHMTTNHKESSDERSNRKAGKVH